MYVCVCMYVYTFERTYVRIMYVCVCMYIRMYVCTYVCVYVCNVIAARRNKLRY